MDWKTHIKIDDGAKAAAAIFIPFATEEFLVTLANKGLYKRAQKDLSAIGKIEIQPEEENLKVTLPDATVLLKPNISGSTCSCPSKVICKHILMGILAVKAASPENNENAITESDSIETVAVASAKDIDPDSEVQSKSGTVSSESWKSLKEIDIISLRKKAGKRLFEDTLRLIQNGWTADFKEGEMLEATINTENITVYFPKENSLEYAVCKCGESGLCKHKLIAVLSFLSTQNLLSETEGQDSSSISFLSDAAKELICSAGCFVTGILEKGIISCSDNDSESAIQYAVRLETSGIGNLARMFRSLSSDLENMLSKHVAFNPLTTFATLSRLHNTIRLILRHEGNTQILSELIENTRSDYYTTPIGTFTGLGAVPWQTRSGYFGLTAYLFHHEKQDVCTYTISMAGYYSQTEALATMENLRKRYDKNEHWAEEISLADLSKSIFTLRNFKMNSRNRLSSSARTHYESGGKFTLENIKSLRTYPALFDLTPDAGNGKFTYFGKKEQEQIVCIPFTCIVNADFNRTEQKLYIEMKNEKDEPVNATIEFNDFTLPAIRKLEKMAGSPDHLFRYMVCRKIQAGFMPVCMIEKNGINNFFFNEFL